MTPFDHLKNLHTKKKNWNDFNDEEKKNFNIFIINKALSFNPNYLNIVNLVQKYSAGQITQKEVFKISLSDMMCGTEKKDRFLGWGPQPRLEVWYRKKGPFFRVGSPTSP